MANHTDRAHWLGASMLAIIVAATAVPAMAQDAAPQTDSAPQDDPASTIVVTGRNSGRCIGFGVAVGSGAIVGVKTVLGSKPERGSITS